MLGGCMSCISFTPLGKREKPNFWNKTCISHKFRKFELRNLTFSKKVKLPILELNKHRFLIPVTYTGEVRALALQNSPEMMIRQK